MNTRESYVVPQTGKHWGYLQALPADYHETDKDYPLVIFLHGTGECGNGTTELDRVAIHGYPKYADELTHVHHGAPPRFGLSRPDYDAINYIDAPDHSFRAAPSLALLKKAFGM